MAEGTTASPNRFVSVPVMRLMARRMIPFYCRIANNRKYAEAWTAGVRKADVNALVRLLKQVGIQVPSREVGSFATNGIGYFVEFNAPSPINLYADGTTLQPGTTQSYFNTTVHRAIARAVLPLYRAIAFQPVFAKLVVRAIVTGKLRLLHVLVRSKVKTLALRTIQIQESGFRLGFKYAASRFVFYNLCFQSGI
ncbi:hypothetical protein [Paenibacillus cremeus]|uniref:Uncharacterized protein n=1 Tax=Paenibacillus cremeus TaxID=2163881 RepID=A0A559KF84_9BACL|nr:hypothetical protein [Paenibacillus cremeus]TVY10785.1 hypothetical protein FPZ49_06715 [Paenibacillus cremeus]